MLKQLKSAKRPTKKKSKPRKKVDVLDDEQPKSFWQRFGFQKKTADLSALEMGTTTILDIISPSTVDTRSRDYIIVDEVLHAYLYITGYAPIAQAMAWLSGRNTVTSMDLLALKWYLWQKPIDRQLVDATLERLCVNPLQDKVHTIRGMADEIRLEFEEAQNNASGTEGSELRKRMTRPLQKFRSEITRLYRQQMELSAAAQTEAERELVTDLLTDMEALNKRTTESIGFTYIPLDQLELMN